jgi:hypothetical protein
MPHPYDETTALAIIKREGLNSRTLDTWKHRGTIPTKYFRAPERRISLYEVEGLEGNIETAVAKYSTPLTTLLEKRKFADGKDIGYYRVALVSLSREAQKNILTERNGKPLSEIQIRRYHAELEKLKTKRAALHDEIVLLDAKIEEKRRRLSI